MVPDFRRTKPPTKPALVEGVGVKLSSFYKYPSMQLDNKLAWSVNSDHLYRKGQTRMHFLRRLAASYPCRKLLQSFFFYQSMVASALFFGVVCWGGRLRKRDTNRLDRLIRRAGSVVGMELESRTLDKLLAIIDEVSHPLHAPITAQWSSFSSRLLSLSCSIDLLRKSSLSRAIRLYNSTLARGGGRGALRHYR